MPWRKTLVLEKFRDVSVFFAFFRDILLGRKYNLHNRFAPKISPRSIPPPELTRAPEYKLSDQYYFKRAAFDSVHPPMIAPIAEGPPIAHPKNRKPTDGTGFKPDAIYFPTAPTPGTVWWWDGHSYFESVLDRPLPPCPKYNIAPFPCPDPPPPKSTAGSATCPPGHPPCPDEKNEENPPPCPRPPKH